MAEPTNSIMPMKRILEELKLSNLIPTFESEKIDSSNFLSLSEEQVIILGVTALGDRIKLEEKVRENQREKKTNLADLIKSQRDVLFIGTRKGKKQRKSSKISSSNKKPRGIGNRRWTVTVVCLPNKDSKSIPTALQKETNFKAGLGPKKICLSTNDTESEVMAKISSDAIDENSENLGIPQLQTCGGFELLKCRQNCRDLTLIDCEWNAMTLKKFLGNQAKIYVRPIQRSLSTDPVNEHSEQEQSKAHCHYCRQMFSVRELREHLHACELRSNLISESEDELPDPHLTQDFSIKKSDFEEVIDQKTALEQVENFVSDKSPESPEQLRTGHLTVPENTSSGDLFVDRSSVQTEFSSQILNQTVINDVTPAEDMEDESQGTTSDACGGPMDFIIAKAIDYCISESIQDPVEILRYLQSVIVCGRQLEITDTTQCDEGDTNFIIVDRNNILETGFEEVNSISNLQKTLEVQFYDETAIDQGGPRKEFLALILSAIKEKYFDKGLREFMAADYTVIGKLIGLSMLQNGPVPKFFDESTLNRLFSNNSSEEFESACVHNLKKGLDCLGLIKVGCVLPMFRHLFRPSSCTLTIKAVIQLLQPKFSEEGSNSKRYESAVYTLFLKYLRAVASGRRGTVGLRDVLQFATGATEEPVLGFVLHPSIEFVESTPGTSFNPTASTCTNTLKIPRPSAEIPLPQEEDLFSYYDYAFSNAYFGLM